MNYSNDFSYEPTDIGMPLHIEHFPLLGYRSIVIVNQRRSLSINRVEIAEILSQIKIMAELDQFNGLSPQDTEILSYLEKIS